MTINFYDSLSEAQKKKVDELVKSRLLDENNDKSREQLQEQLSKELYKLIKG